MSYKDYELLCVLDYPITEKLFKEMVGSGEQLRRLIEDKVLVEERPGQLYNVNFNSQILGGLEKKSNKKELHEKIIRDYYKKNIEEDINGDYILFKDNYLEYINLGFHYRHLEDYDSGIKYLFYIAKKLVYWGLGHELLEELSKYEENKISHENYLWKQYYTFFYQLIHPAIGIGKDDFMKFTDEIDINKTYLLYLETKNLEGIYYKNIENDRLKAIDVFEESTRVYQAKDKKDKAEGIVYARILENMAMSRDESSFKDANLDLDIAENIFKKYEDNYELSKLYFFRALLLSRDEHSNLDDILEVYEKNNSIVEEIAFPDIERNFYNLLSEYMFNEAEDFEEYIKMKIQALTTDLVLYYENFVTDMISILYKIRDIIKVQKDKVLPGLDILLGFLDEVDLKEESYLIRGIYSLIEGEDVEASLEKISSDDFKKFAYKYIEEISN